MIRLQKYLASAGVASRRASEKLITEGRICVNDKVVTELGTSINPEEDVVYFDGQRVTAAQSYVYYLLNKPKGYVTTAKDQFNRPTVTDLLKEVSVRIYPIGRLDYNTTGLLLLTNDGDLTLKLTHPKHEIFKTYVATIKGRISESALELLREGVQLEDFLTSPAEVKLIKREEMQSLVEISIREGKYRQVRRMFEAVGFPVEELSRVKIGEITLSGLREGCYRPLTPSEIAYLKEMTGGMTSC